MPQFHLRDIEGRVFDLARLEGKVAFIDIWATWCIPCIIEIPSHIDLYEAYADDGLAVLGITVRSGGADDIRHVVERLGIDYPILVGDDDVMSAFGGVEGFPTNFLITRNGKIYKRYLGVYPNKKEIVEKDILELLAHRPSHGK